MVTLCELLDVRHRVPPAFCCCACQQHHMQMKHIPSANGPTQTVCTQHGRPCGHELRGRSWRLCRTSGGSAFGECAARGDSSVLGNWCALARVRASEGQQTRSTSLTWGARDRRPSPPPAPKAAAPESSWDGGDLLFETGQLQRHGILGVFAVASSCLLHIPHRAPALT